MFLIIFYSLKEQLHDFWISNLVRKKNNTLQSKTRIASKLALT